MDSMVNFNLLLNIENETTQKKHVNDYGLDEKIESTNAACKNGQWAQDDRSLHHVFFQHESDQDHMMNFPQFDS
jgi:hypothetical protein